LKLVARILQSEELRKDKNALELIDKHRDETFSLVIGSLDLLYKDNKIWREAEAKCSLTRIDYLKTKLPTNVA
jgi:hypothetical protein